MTKVLLNYLHLQQSTQGAAMRSSGEATRSRIPNPANIPITYTNTVPVSVRHVITVGQGKALRRKKLTAFFFLK